MTKSTDIYFVANTTAFPGWAVYRKSTDQEPRDPRRWHVHVVAQQAGVEGPRTSIPRACVRIRTRQLSSAARAAAVFNTADRLEADCVAAAKAQRSYTFSQTIERYDIPT